MSGTRAVERFIEEWEERRSGELTESLSDEFEDGLDEQVNAEMEKCLDEQQQEHETVG